MTVNVLNIEQERAYVTPYSASPLLPLLLLSLLSQKHTPNTKKTFRKKYDYIVVGAGSAGSVVASRLSEKTCVTVLLLEAGKPPPRLTDIPGITRNFVYSDIDWKYVTEPLKHTGSGHIDRKIPWPSGKTVGGSSVLNGMLYVRGNRKNYDAWANLGAEGWSYKDVLYYFKKLEDNTNYTYLQNGYHGVCGPITATNPVYYPIKKQAIMTALRNEGYEFVDPNGPKQNGFYDYQGSMRKGQRCSTAKGYLVPAENRKNLDIVPNAFVRKVLIKNKKARGVEFDFNGKTYQVKARKEVILSAGTVNTAQLLMLSGIGPEKELNKCNIAPNAILDVGLNMYDHPAASLVFEVNDTLPTFDSELRKKSNIFNYVENKQGPLETAEGCLLMSALSNSQNGSVGDPVYTIYIADFESLLFRQQRFTNEIIQKFLLPLQNKTTIICGVQLLNPKSKGKVTLKSTDPYDPPLIDPNYYDDIQDLNTIVDGMKVCLKIMNNPAMKEIGAKPVDVLVPGCETFSQNSDMDGYLACIVKTIVYTTSHQVGTAKMGKKDDPTTVVDYELRVKGIKGLRVVDASVMPTIPWSNTNIPTIMVAEKASDIIKKTIKCKKKDDTISHCPIRKS